MTEDLSEPLPHERVEEPGALCCGKEELEALLREVTVLAARLKQLAVDLQTPDGLPIGGKMVLEVLVRYGTKTVPQIARIRSTSRQNIQVLVNRLESDGHVALVPNPSHRRSPFVRVTEQGTVALGEMSRAEEGFIQTLLPQLGKTDVRSALDLLSRIRSLLVGREQLPAAQVSHELPTEGHVPTLAPAGKKSRYRRRSHIRMQPVESPNAEVSGSTELPVNLL